VLSFIRKTGQGIGGAVAACIIGLGGYIATAKTQAGSALTSIRVAAGIIPPSSSSPQQPSCWSTR
jgi:glucuronide carrier protein